MHALRSARTVIIDDEFEAALPLIHVLGSQGIGVSYFNGEKEHLPPHPLDGIRVVFLDLRLFEAIPSESRHYIAATLPILKRIVAPSRGGTGIVCWTMHPEDITELEKQLPKVMPKFTPAFILRLDDKPALVADHVQLNRAVDEKMTTLPAHQIMWDWEQIVHDAATDTTNMILDLSEPEKKDVLCVLQALSNAAGGKTATDEVSCLRNLYEALNPLHFDRMEQGSRMVKATKLHAKSLCPKSKPSLSSAQKAKLNRAMLSADVLGGTRPIPGNVYVASSNMGVKCPVTRCDLKPSMVEEWTGDPSSWPCWTKDDEYKKLKKAKNTEPEKDGLLKARREAILDECLSALVELTPGCDYAQGKQRIARFVAGLLLPAKYTKIFPIRPEHKIYLKDIPELFIESLNGDWQLILNARYLFTIPNPSRRVCSQPLLRLRSHVLVDIQAWFAAHAARPGYLSV